MPLSVRYDIKQFKRITVFSQAQEITHLNDVLTKYEVALFVATKGK